MTGLFEINSLAALNASEITVIGLNASLQTVGFAVNAATGNATEVFGATQGSGDGQVNNALYESYGPDGLLYVLDYGNQRVQVFAPCRNPDGSPCAYTYVRQFAISSNVENAQFGIGADGNLYFADGEGGGYAYDSNGDPLGTFSLPAGYANAQTNYMAIRTGVDEITTDALNDIFVYDATGMHIYQDDSTAAPEPGSLGLLVAGAIGIAAAGRWRKRLAGEAWRWDCVTRGPMTRASTHCAG